MTLNPIETVTAIIWQKNNKLSSDKDSDVIGVASATVFMKRQMDRRMVISEKYSLKFEILNKNTQI